MHVHAFLRHPQPSAVTPQPCRSMQASLESRRFFARPRLALDAVGGESGVRLAEALADVSFDSGFFPFDSEV